MEPGNDFFQLNLNPSGISAGERNPFPKKKKKNISFSFKFIKKEKKRISEATEIGDDKTRR